MNKMNDKICPYGCLERKGSKMKRLISLICVMVLLLGCLSVNAYADDWDEDWDMLIASKSGQCGEELYWFTTLDYVLRLAGEGAMYDANCADAYSMFMMREYIGAIVFPEGVTSIGDYSFAEYELQSMFLPLSLERIGQFAFWHCPELTDVFYAGSEEDWAKVEIGRKNDGLDHVTVHYNCAGGTVGTCQTYSNPSISAMFKPGTLWSLTGNELTVFGSGKTATNERSVFCRTDWNRYYTVTEEVKNVTVKEGVTSLGMDLFRGFDQMTDISLPHSLGIIGNNAFTGCAKLKDVWFAGSKAEWDTISIGTGNECLTGARIHFGDEPVDLIRAITGSVTSRSRTVKGRFVCPEGQPVEAIAVRYDENGRMLSVELGSFTASGSLEVVLENGENAKFLAVDPKTSAPLCEGVIVP